MEENLLGLGFLEVKGEAALATIHGQEIVAEISVPGLGASDQSHEHVTAQIANIAHLDLNHIRAHVGEEKTSIRPLNLLRDFDDFNSREWSGHKCPLQINSLARFYG